MDAERGSGGLARNDETREIEVSRALGEYLSQMATGHTPNLSEFLSRRASVAADLAGPLQTLRELSLLCQGAHPPRVFGDFRILREVGRGGMGVVYEAWQLSLNRRVALKVLPPDRLSLANAVARFHREAKLIASLQHPSIIRIHMSGIEGGVPYFAMEFVEGATLRQLQGRLQSGEDGLPSEATAHAGARGGFPESAEPAGGGLGIPVDHSGRDWAGEIASLGAPSGEAAPSAPALPSQARQLQLALAFAEAADGLHHAHTRGVVHRDIKPSNLLLDSDGRLRILDFGLAFMEGDPRLTDSAERIGTPLYMSPEQARGDPHVLDRGTDIYSLGATLYETLAGKPPFQGRSCQETIQQIVHRDPAPLRNVSPTISRDLETIVMKCLRKEPRARYATAQALAQDLRRFATGDPIEARPQPGYAALARRLWRSRRRVLEAASGALLLATVALLVSNNIRESRRQKQAWYETEVRAASAAIDQRPVLLAASGIRETGGERVLLPPRSGDTVLSTKREGGYHRLFEGGRDVVEAGAALVSVAPDPVRSAIERLRRAVKEWPDPPVGHYHLARGLLLLQDLRGAQSQLEAALERDPRFIPASTLLESLRRSGEPQVRELAAEVAASAPPARPDPRPPVDGWAAAWLEAHSANLSGDWRACERAYGALIQSQPSGREHFIGSILEARLGRGLARLALGDRDGALLDFSAAMERSTGEVEPTLLLAKTFHLKGDLKRAEGILTQLVKEVDASRVDEVGLAIAATYEEVGDDDAALRWLKSRKETPARGCLEAEALRRLGRLDDALQTARRAESAAPADPAVRLTLGNVFLSLGQLEEARLEYQKCSGLDSSNPKPHVALGICLEAQGSLEEAEKELGIAIEMDPRLAAAHYNLGRILGRMGRLDEAMAAYQQSAELDVSAALAYNNMGTILDRQGKLEEALVNYERAARLSPRLALAHYNIAWTCHRQMRFERAAAQYQEALELGLEDAQVHNNRGACLQNSGKIEQAIQSYRRALEVDPDSALAHHGLGTALEHTRDAEQMVAAYERAARLLPDWVAARNDLGWALHRQERLEEALAEYTAAIDGDPTFVWAHNNRATLILANERFLPAGDDLCALIRSLEVAERLPNASPGIGCLLERCRRAISPRLASYASIDARLDLPEPIIADGASWQYTAAAREPLADSSWRELSLDASGWRSGSGGFGASGGEARTVLGEDGRHGVLYLRHSFEMADPGRYSSLCLRMRAQDGFIAYLNGTEVARFRMGYGRGEVEPRAVADSTETEPWLTRAFPVPSTLLQKGTNVVAIQVVRSWSQGGEATVSATPTLEGRAVADEKTRSDAAAALITFREAGGDALALNYFEGRLCEQDGRLDEAVAKLRKVVSSDAGSPEPFLRLASCLRGQGDLPGAERCLREGLEGGLQDHEPLWRAWLDAVLCDHGGDLAAALRSFPKLDEPPGAGVAGDVRWVLSSLETEGALRINCGGADYRDHGGRLWSRDRWFRDGYIRYLPDCASGLDAALAEDDAICRTGREYWGPHPLASGYSIPLPSGTYSVALCFAERVQSPSTAGEAIPGPSGAPSSSLEAGAPGGAATASFDVLVEGAPLLEHIGAGEGDPRRPTLCEVELEVLDGALDIDFERLSGNPLIISIEVGRLPPR